MKPPAGGRPHRVDPADHARADRRRTRGGDQRAGAASAGRARRRRPADRGRQGRSSPRAVAAGPPTGPGAAPVARAVSAGRPGRAGAPAVRLRTASGGAAARAVIRARVAGGHRAHEPVTPVHPPAGRDGAADGGAAAVGHPRLPAAAGLGAAAGRLPDDPHHHLLSGRQPGGDDELGDGAARAAVRPASRPGADVVDELGRRFGDHAALRAREAAQRRRAGSAGGDERRQQPAAERPAAAAGLQQGQPGRHAGADAGGDVGDGAAAADLRPDRHPRGAEAVAAARRRPGQHRRRPAAGRAHPGQPAGARRRAGSTCRTSARSSPRPTSTSRRAASTGRSARSRSTPTISCARPRPTRS